MHPYTGPTEVPDYLDVATFAWRRSRVSLFKPSGTYNFKFSKELVKKCCPF